VPDRQAILEDAVTAEECSVPIAELELEQGDGPSQPSGV
jgi:hypothetical protein